MGYNTFGKKYLQQSFNVKEFFLQTALNVLISIMGRGAQVTLNNILTMTKAVQFQS